jgi:hypothetical protein
MASGSASTSSLDGNGSGRTVILFFPAPTFAKKAFGSNDAAVSVGTSVILLMAKSDALQQTHSPVLR